MKKILNIAIALAALTPACLTAEADNAKNVLDIKHSITDSNIVYPESYELNTQKRLEGWYLKNYTASDERYSKQGDVPTSDDVFRDRLAKMNTVIDMPYNQIVRSYIERYTAKGRAAVSTLLGLSNYYMPIFEQALEERGLPLELKYLPIIESGLNPNAVSRSGAAGLWQFILATGKGLDMEISSLVDERRDPFKSSQKAADYLKSLYDTYGDWSLAIAAYNCGPGTVNKALRRAGGDTSAHDFWSIYYFLPAETRGYVPMFIAANYVMNYYPYHNISPVLVTKPLITDTLMISKRVHFDQICNVLDIPIDELRVLNPQFRADIIPGLPERQYTLVLPSQQIHAYIMSEDAILAYEADKYARRTDAQPGEQPSAIVAEEIETETFLADDTPQEGPTQAASVSLPAKKSSSGPAKTITHKVEPGETLAAIAEKYDVTPEQIKSWNNMRRNSVRTGQVLRVTTGSDLADSSDSPATQPAPAPKAAQPKKEAPKATTAQNTAKKPAKADTAKKKTPAAPTTHSVKSGENLTVIAKKYGTTVDELKKANNLSGDNIRPGESLKLPSKAKAASGKSAKSTAKAKAPAKKSTRKKKR